MNDKSRQIIEWTQLKIQLEETKKHEIFFCEREIWWASIGSNIGFEEDGKHELFERPVLILYKFNLELFWALPMSSKQKVGKYYFPCFFNKERYVILLSQLRLLSSKRLTRKIRTLSETEFNQVRTRIREWLL